MSSENQEDLTTPDMNEGLPSDSIRVEKTSENKKSTSTQSSLEVGEGDYTRSPDNIKNDALDPVPTDKGDEIVLGVEDGNSDEDLQLKWEDEDEDIEEDIISLHLPEDATLEEQASYAAAVSDIDQSEIAKTPKQAIEDKIDKEIIDITDLTSPIPDEIETQTNVDVSHIKEEVDKINEKIMKNADNAITIYDVDDNVKVDQSITANAVDDDDLIIIEDDNDDIEDTTVNPDEKHVLGEKADSIENNIDLFASNNDAVPKTPNNSLMETSTTESNLEHGLNKPDMMLEIPTQEIIDCLDDSDVSYSNVTIEQDLKNDNSQDMKEMPKSVDESVIDVDEEPTSMQKNKISDNVEYKVKSSAEEVILQAKLTDDIIKPSEISVKPTDQTTKSETCVNENKVQVAESKEITSDLTANENKDTVENNTIEDVEMIDLEHTEGPIITEGIKGEIAKDTESTETCKEVVKETIDSCDISMEVNSTLEETVNETLQAPTTSTDKLEVDNGKSLSSDTLKSSKDEVQATTSDVVKSNPDTSDEKLSEPVQESGLKEMSVSQMSIDEVADQTVAPANDETADVISKETVSAKPSTPQDEPTSEPSKNTEPSKNIAHDKVTTEIPNEKSVTEDLQVPSTSGTIDQPTDSNDDVPEMSDSLGLLAESSRVIEDDEEPEDEEDDDEDFDQDESSNQMTAEHSEDSNAQHSETDGPKEQEDKGVDTPQEVKEEFNFAASDVVTGETEAEKEGDAVAEDVCVKEEGIATGQTVEESAAKEAVPDAKIEEAAEKGTSKPTNEAMEVETVKLSDTSDTEIEENNRSILKSLLKEAANKETSKPVEEVKKSPTKKLEITKPRNCVLNIVDLEESSSEDDLQEVNKKLKNTEEVDGSELIVSADIEVTSSPVASPPKTNRMTRINTSEVTIKTTTSTESKLVIPEAKPSEERPKTKFSLEIFNLDSDEEDSAPALEPTKKPTAMETEKPRETNKCVNLSCTSGCKVNFYPADLTTIAYYGATKKRKPMVCENCAAAVAKRTEDLISGIKNFAPLLDLGIVKESSELVEISDSESEEETDSGEDHSETIGEEGAAMLEQHLRDVINETWRKFKLDSRLSEAEDSLNKEMQKLEEDSKEIDSLLNECQIATDKLRKDLYDTFEFDRRELAPLIIFDTPLNKYSCLESMESSTSKRSLSSGPEPPAKKAAIPLGYTPLDHDTKETPSAQQDKPTPAVPDTSKVDDDKDIAVLKVSAESAPSDLPPLGEPNMPPLKPGMVVFAMRNTFRSWVRSTIIECQGKNTMPGSAHSFMMVRVRVESSKGRAGPIKLLPGRWLAYNEPSNARMTIGTRIIALFKDGEESDQKRTFFSGIIAEVPNPVNNYRYLVFFDDGYAQYVRHADTRLVCESSPLVWEEVHPLSREFIREYLVAYPERPMVRLHAGQSLKTEWNGKWWPSRVVQVDASLVKVYFEEDNRSEWIYRGSTRLAPLYLELQAAERHRARPMPRTKQPRVNMPYVEYLRSDEQNKSEEPAPPPQQQNEQRESRQRAVAKKSTAAPQPQPPQPSTDNVISRVVYYTPKNAVKPYKMTAHSCGPHCKRSDVLALKDLRTYNPLAKPLLSGWERQIVRFKGHKDVIYRAPCGRRLRNMRELHRYLRNIQSDMAVDLFDFAPGTHCLAEFVLNTCRVGKKDLSHGKENVPVPCVNYYDDSLPEFCSYNTERTPTAGVPLNLDPEFLCGCDCTDDCMDKKKCACWQMTLEGARTIGLQGTNLGYVYKRLPEPLPSGIYECNSRCKCKQTCLNRVAQHPLQLKLQVFKTLNRGWGIRALNDVPKGSFLCVYAGNLLTDATANMDGLNEGDEYLAELDYIEVVEQMKEGYEEDIPEADKKLDRKNQAKPDEEESEEDLSSSEDDTRDSRLEKEDDDFRPPFIGLGVTEFSKRLRKRDKKKEKEDAQAKEDKEEKEKEQKEQRGEDDCITISDDEEVREPSRFTAQAGMRSNEFISKYRSVRSHFGKDEACYIMDAKVQGNIGRYLNHSCCPNVFVQNVFVDTHDPRFPWVAFFALCHIKAGTELTWNYNYDVGSVPGKVLYCYCGAPNCRGRLL